MDEQRSVFAHTFEGVLVTWQSKNIKGYTELLVTI